MGSCYESPSFWSFYLDIHILFEDRLYCSAAVSLSCLLYFGGGWTFVALLFQASGLLPCSCFGTACFPVNVLPCILRLQWSVKGIVMDCAVGFISLCFCASRVSFPSDVM